MKADGRRSGLPSSDKPSKKCIEKKKGKPINKA